MATHVLPGDVLASSSLPTPPANSKKGLKVGPGLQQLGPSELRSVVAGTLVTDNKKNAAWVEVPDGRYAPTLNDPVLATVLRSTGDAFLCSLSAHSPPASLPHLAFEGVSKKTRPQFAAGTLVYARVSSAPSRLFLEPELTCIDPNNPGGGGGTSSSSSSPSGLGELKGGMVYDVSLGFARRLLVGRQRERAGLAVLEELSARGLAFEVGVGRNGRVWVKAEAGDIKKTLAVGTALVETDKGNLDVEAQKKLVKRILRTLQ